MKLGLVQSCKVSAKLIKKMKQNNRCFFTARSFRQYVGVFSSFAIWKLSSRRINFEYFLQTQNFRRFEYFII